MTLNRKIRVLQIQNSYDANPSDLAEQIVKGLPGDRFEVTSAFLKKKPNPGDPARAAQESVYFDFSSSQLKGVQRYIALYRLYRFCKSKAFDVVICHRFKPTHLMLLLGSLLKIPLCLSVTHGIGDYDRRYRQKAVSRYIDENWRFIGVSEPVRQDLISHCEGLNENNTLAINNAIDINRAMSIQHSRDKACSLLGISESKFVFGTIGRLVEVKGHKYLIEAADRLKNRYSNIMVVIVGGGRLERTLQQQIDDAGLNDHVVLSGWKDDALQYVKAFDVFALPSLSEGMPISLLEAMSGGVPTLGSDIPSIRPVIEKIGQLATSEDSVSLAKAMEYYLQLSSAELQQSGDAHLAYLKAHHSIEDYRQQYRRLIEDNLS